MSLQLAIDLLRLVAKFNPNHDSLGRFSSGNGSGAGPSSKEKAIAEYDRTKAEYERIEALSHYNQPKEVRESVTWQERQAAREKYEEATTKLYMEFDAEYESMVSAEESKSKQVSPAKSVAALDATFDGHTLDPEPANGFEHYRNDGNKVINGVLRGKAKGLSMDDALKNAEPYGDQSWRTMMAPVTERSIAGLDEAFQKAPALKADVTVHRVIASGLAATGFKGVVPGTYDSRRAKHLYSSESSLHVAKALKQMEGTIFTDPGYVSTTTAKGETTKWSRRLNKNNEYEQPIYFTIRVPKGTKTLWAPKIAKEEDVFVKKEVLLPRNTRYKIVRVHVPKKLGGPFHVEMEVVND
jgi:hypothetical protein